MLSGMNDFENEPVFDYRTINERFQQRLLEAQKTANEKEIEADLNLAGSPDLPDAVDPLETERQILEAQVARAEKDVEELKKQVADRKARRLREAALLKMTPEERARVVEEQEKAAEEGMPIDDDVDDMDVVFEYLLHIGETPLPRNAANMSRTDLMSSHAEFRTRAMQDPEVEKQGEFAHLRFTEAKNRLTPNPNGQGEIRSCELIGETYQQSFKICFDVYEPNFVVDNLVFDLSIEMQLDCGSILQEIVDESDLLAFFRLLVHYARLDDERKKVFNQLKEKLADTRITLLPMAEDRLKFQSNRNDEPELYLLWKTKVIESEHADLDANICERVLPDIRMEADTSEKWSLVDEKGVMDHLPTHFTQTMKLKGVFLATLIMVDAVFDMGLA
ncbi:uncharacterized protein BYT42DRAFT_245711 [Radiomyces spectabilis]|uniref:uncharacterized protein n=1 Tax=Radiomyces spectabilis TaxID=64574 RepID=UPI00221E4E1E|nr:uncharacterized protein BYT42DRAFT_245711 [Radiomyces spectabilis]KAI8388758.1 hypothetical protein BYT42DRAFT_245711 [Radiomyces spectabilis]